MADHLLDRAHHEVYGESTGTDKSAKVVMQSPKSKLVRSMPKKETIDLSAIFSMGDNVTVLPNEETGVVYQPADKNGDVIVQVKGIKRTVKYNRLRLKVSAAELYPPNYDFSIIFDSVENRKARKRMGKRHNPNITITHD